MINYDTVCMSLSYSSFSNTFQESVDVKKIAQLRPFADLLMIEMCAGSLSFLGKHMVPLKDLEVLVHKVIAKLETPRVLEKSENLPQPSSYEKAKFKIKDCNLQLVDAKDQKMCEAAFNIYKKEKEIRIQKKKKQLLMYLKNSGKLKLFISSVLGFERKWTIQIRDV